LSKGDGDGEGEQGPGGRHIVGSAEYYGMGEGMLSEIFGKIVSSAIYGLAPCGAALWDHGQIGFGRAMLN